MSDIEKALDLIRRDTKYIVRSVEMKDFYPPPKANPAPPCAVCEVFFEKGYYVLQPFKSKVFVCSLECADFWILQNA